jgi:hypothetical protein
MQKLQEISLLNYYTKMNEHLFGVGKSEVKKGQEIPDLQQKKGIYTIKLSMRIKEQTMLQKACTANFREL